MDQEDFEIRENLLDILQDTKLALKHFNRNTNPKDKNTDELIVLEITSELDKKQLYSELNQLIKQIHQNTKYKIDKPEIIYGGEYFSDTLKKPDEKEITGKIDIDITLKLKHQKEK